MTAAVVWVGFGRAHSETTARPTVAGVAITPVRAHGERQGAP
jgi:hypothetical protein